MKNLIVVAIACITVSAVAQTNSTATASTTAPAATTETIAAQPATAAAPVVKKEKKKKKKEVKKTSMAPASTTPAASLAQAVAPAQLSPTTDVPSGTSTAAAADVAPVKKWKGSVKAVAGSDHSEAQFLQVLSTASLSYKLTDKISVKAAQTFETLNVGNHNADQRELLQRSNFRAAYTDLGISTTTKGILGSNDMPLSFNFKKISGDALIAQKTDYAAIDTVTDLNFSLPYTLNPKFELSVDNQVRYYQNDVAAKSAFRVLSVPTLTYSLNDVVSIYQGAGIILSMRDNMDMRRNYERAYLATGVGIAATKSLSIDMNIWQDKAITSSNDKYKVSAFAPYQITKSDEEAKTFDSVGAEATVAYSF